MLSRAVVRGLAADTRSLSLRPLTLRFREATPFTPIAPLVARLSSPYASTKPSAACLSRPYATAQPTRRKTTSRSPAKKTATKKKPGPKKAKKKPAPKKKTGPKKKKPAPKTETELLRAKVRDLRQKALVQTPKLLPQTAYLVFTSENITKGISAPLQAQQNAAAFRNLSASQQEHLQNVAQQNRRANEKTMQDWIESHTPDEIRLANNARRQLNKMVKDKTQPPGAGRPLIRRGYNYLIDSRRPVRYETPYITFSRERWASGDFNGVPVGEAGKRIGQEWQAISTAEQKKYYDAAAAEKSKWTQQMNRLYSTSGTTK